MYDFTNHPIWANNGIRTQPGFVDAGWTCGGVNPDHMNWWMHRTDTALLDLHNRVTTNTTNIENLTTIVEDLGNTFEANGILGVYVSDPGIYKAVSTAGVYTTVQTFTHTVQSTGQVHLNVGYEAAPHLTPSATSIQHCYGRVRLQVNNQIVIVAVYGHTHANPANRLTQIYGAQHVMRRINAPGFNWAVIGQPGFTNFTKGDTVVLKFEAQIHAGQTGSLGLGFPKLIVEEYRATT